jgi:hypothetical protein
VSVSCLIRRNPNPRKIIFNFQQLRPSLSTICCSVNRALAFKTDELNIDQIHRRRLIIDCSTIGFPVEQYRNITSDANYADSLNNELFASVKSRISREEA